MYIVLNVSNSFFTESFDGDELWVIAARRRIGIEWLGGDAPDGDGGDGDDVDERMRLL